MAIPFQSEFNNINAIGIVASDGDLSALSLFSGSEISEVVRGQIVGAIAEALENFDPDIPGNIPSEVYSIVAELLEPFTPSLSVESLTAVLRSNSVFGNLPVGDLNVVAIIEDQLGMFINQYERKLLEIEGGIGAVLRKYGISDNLGAIVTELSGNVFATVNGVLGSALSQFELSKVSPEVVATLLRGEGIINIAADLPQIANLSGDPTVARLLSSTTDELGNVDIGSLTDAQRQTLAAAYVKGASGTELSVSNLSGLMKKTQGTIAGTIDRTEELPSPNPFPIDADTINPEGSFISSVEELESEMASITRDVSEVIVHWSETYTNSNLSAAQLTELTGAGDNAYHFIIRRDGSVERGVNLNSKGNHCDTLGHNDYSLGVCFIGGLNVSTGSERLYEISSSRSITISQYNSFYHIMRTFFQQFPGGQALGHMDIDPNQEDPGFDVRDYAFNNFNKQSLYLNAYEETALSPDDIIKILEQPRSENGIVISTPSALNKETDIMEKTF